MVFVWILTLAIVAGQLIKIPIGTHGGVTLLDSTVVILCLLGLRKLHFKLKNPPFLIKTGIIFTLIAILSLILTPLHLSSNQYLTSFFYTVRFFMFILFGWIIYCGVFPDIKKNIFPILIFSGFILSILGLLQLIFIPNLMFLEKYGWDPHYFRTVSTFLDPSFVGAYFTLTLILLIQKPINLSLNLQKIIFLSSYLALLATFSRGAYLMFGVSFTMLTLFNKSIKLAILTLLLSLGLWLGYNSYNKSVAEVRNIDRGQSAQFRLNSWQRGLLIFTKSPILGVGYNTYRYALKEYNLVPENYLASRGGASNDSSLLHIASTTGIVGLIFFLIFLASLIWIKKAIFPFKDEWVILVGGLSGLVAHSFFANSLFYPFLLIWLLLVAVKIHS